MRSAWPTCRSPRLTAGTSTRRAEVDAIELDSIRAQEGCWDVLSHAWQRVTSGSSWQEDSERFGGLLGWARAVEVTDGHNGWHVHLPVLLCSASRSPSTSSGPPPVRASSVGGAAPWKRRGFSASEENGSDLRRAQLSDGDLADYFTKMAHEVTGGHRKEGRTRGGRSPMQLLLDAVETYEETATARWWEWEAASDGRRQLTWSTGRRDLRDLAGLGREASDEEIADEEQDADVRIGLAADTCRWLTELGKVCELLRVFEAGGQDAAVSRLRLFDCNPSSAGWERAPHQSLKNLSSTSVYTALFSGGVPTGASSGSWRAIHVGDFSWIALDQRSRTCCVLRHVPSLGTKGCRNRVQI